MVGPGPNGETPNWATNMQTWTQTRKQAVDSTLNTVMDGKFGGPDGFGSLDAALIEFGVSEKRPIVLFQPPNYNPNVPVQTSMVTGGNAFVNVYDSWFTRSDKEELLGHEMAHYWDFAHNDKLDQEMKGWINWGTEATDYGTFSDDEDFAEAVTVYFWNNYKNEGKNREWTDDDWAGLNNYSWTSGPDQLMLDASTNQPSQTGTIPVYDRYDWLECKFTNNNCKP